MVVEDSEHSVHYYSYWEYYLLFKALKLLCEKIFYLSINSFLKSNYN